MTMSKNQKKRMEGTSKRINQRTLISNPMVASGPVRLYALLTLLVLLIIAQVANSNLVQQQPAILEQGQGNYNNLVENIISDLMNGDRLKKSKLNGMRNQVKQTLRFGRRSDPWLMAPSAQEQLALEELGNRHSFSD